MGNSQPPDFIGLDDLAQLVEKYFDTKNYKLPGTAINRIAGCLVAHLEDKAWDNLHRESSNIKHQERLIAPVRRGIREAEKRLPDIMCDPMLGPKLLEACAREEPDGVLHRKFMPDAIGIEIYEYKAFLPDSPEERLLTLVELLRWASKGLYALDAEPSKYSTNKKTQESLFLLANDLNEILEEHGTDQKNRASDIADLISLIGLTYTDKTIKNLLS